MRSKCEVKKNLGCLADRTSITPLEKLELLSGRGKRFRHGFGLSVAQGREVGRAPLPTELLGGHEFVTFDQHAAQLLKAQKRKALLLKA